MLNYLKLTIYNQENLHYKMGEALHDYLLEQTDSNYRKQLNQPGLKPFSQYLSFDQHDQSWNWHIATLNEEAYEHMITPMLKKKELLLNSQEKPLEIEKANPAKTVSYKELTRQFYLNDGNCGDIKINFLTPCSFKVKNEYLMHPSLFHIYQSLMQKFSAFSTTIDLMDQQVLNRLTENTQIIDYSLKSSTFQIEKSDIKGFAGSLRLSITGTQTLKSLARLLFAFASYSGIGIKTGHGMGAVQIQMENAFQ